MAVQTLAGPRTRIRISLTGRGRKHYHLVMSSTTGLNGATVDRTFDSQQDAMTKAYAAVDVFEAQGYRATERRDRTLLELARDTVKRYLFIRPCYLRHTPARSVTV